MTECVKIEIARGFEEVAQLWFNRYLPATPPSGA